MNNISAYIWNFASKFGGQLLWLLTTMVLSRFLTPSDFGIVGVLSIIFMVANTLTESGLGGALVIQKELLKEDCSTISVFNIIVSIAIYALIFISADKIEAFYAVEGLADVTRIISLVFVINAWGIVPRTILYRELRFRTMCIVSLTAVLISAIVAIILAFYDFGVYALVVYQIVLAIVNTVGLYIMSHYRLSFKFSLYSFRKLFGFGFYTTITGVLDTIYENILSAVFGKFLSITQAGYLSQAKKIEEASAQSLLSTVNNTAFPILAKKKNNIEDFKQEADVIIKSVPLLIFPALITIAVFSKEIISILFGKKWLPASEYLSMLVFAGMFMIFDAINRNFIKSLGNVDRLFVFTVIKRTIGCCIIILSAIVSVHMVLYGYVLSAFIGFMLNCYLYSKLINESLIVNAKKSLYSLLILSPLFICIYGIYLFVPLLSLKMFMCVLLLIIFYICILPKLGIDIISKIKKLRKV